ncbi:uncharacterized protein LOC122525700 [Polistes fuscatus]|uniref:uncharacterized protein LOC122525700 n=1 Tax=Polistes fuscatus TaxID=30207 RepID=UPI001CA9B24E|nr:uncharacterized protein LOC122525700 [Polistes fuscatus]
MANIDENENVIVIRNLKDSADLLPRIELLRNVLKQLRMTLRQERENLNNEMNYLIKSMGNVKTKHICLDNEHNLFSKFDNPRYNNRGNGCKPTKYPLEVLHFRKGNGDSCSNGNNERLDESNLYQRRVDRLREELDSYDESCSSMSMSSFYKQKIHDLERDCCAGLNKVRDGFVESLQAFENTLEFIRLKEFTKKTSNADGSSLLENFVNGRRKENKFDGVRQRAKWQTLSNDVEKQPPYRTKSVIIGNGNHGRLWLAQICSQRFSDSAICNSAMHPASKFNSENTHRILGILETSSNDLRFSTSFTNIFPIITNATPVITF